MKRDDLPQQPTDVNLMASDIVIKRSSGELLRIIFIGDDHFWVISLIGRKPWTLCRMSGTPLQTIASGEFIRFMPRNTDRPRAGEAVRPRPGKSDCVRRLYGLFNDAPVGEIHRLEEQAP